ncbi:MAG: PKD domain-containing protein [Planctomycetota bacterium]|nr:PKD domain-containing protein [Planctomycetota bacterium]
MQVALGATAMLVALVPLAAAQGRDEVPFAEIQRYSYATGTLENPTGAYRLVHEKVVEVRGAPSLRVFFEEIDVGPDGYLDVVSQSDGEAHRLTSEEILKWRSSSGFFNGDTLVLQLYLAPGTRGGYEISHLLVGLDVFEKTICAADDRVASTDNRAARFLNSAGTSLCTGWLSGSDDCACSAGHCFPGVADVAEFNVPSSTPGGSIVHPPIEDQFPIDQTSLVWNYGGLGNDWAICHLLTNSLGESAAAKFGWFQLGFYTPHAGETIRITGFGSDGGSDNFTQQTSPGPFVAGYSHVLRYEVDTTGGNSGSPVILDDPNVAVGIHTNGGCSGSSGTNSGTGVTQPQFIANYTAQCQQAPVVQPTAAFEVSASAVVETTTVHFRDLSLGQPSSWQWDFDGDGTSDSFVQHPSFAYATPGSYDVSLTVSNAAGGDTLTVPGQVTVAAITPVQPPYAQDFDSGLPGSGEWLFESSSSFGEIAASSYGTPAPLSGDPSLTMAAKTEGQYVTNESTLFLDVQHALGATLTYWFKQTGDENDAEDGLFLSDGTTEVLAQSHQSGPSSWTQFSVDLKAIADGAGIVWGPDLRAIFRQRDNYYLGTDGHLIDGVVVTPIPSLTTDVASVSLSAGGTQTLFLDAGPSRAGYGYTVVGSLSGAEPGTPIAGLHLPLNLPDVYFDLTLLSPGLTPLLGSVGTLDGAGQGTTLFAVPSGSIPSLAGTTVYHAFGALDPTTSTLEFISNAAGCDLFP